MSIEFPSQLTAFLHISIPSHFHSLYFPFFPILLFLPIMFLSVPYISIPLSGTIPSLFIQSFSIPSLLVTFLFLSTPIISIPSHFNSLPCLSIPVDPSHQTFFGKCYTDGLWKQMFSVEMSLFSGNLISIYCIFRVSACLPSVSILSEQALPHWAFRHKIFSNKFPIPCTSINTCVCGTCFKVSG